MKKIATLGVAAAFAVLATPAQAADYEPYQGQIAGLVGHVGGSIGFGRVKEVDDFINNDEDQANPFFGRLDGSAGFRTRSWLFGIEANARYDDFSSTDDFDDDEDPEWQWSFTGHVLHDWTSDTRVGLFGQYGDTRPQDGDKDDAYDYFLVGVEAQTFLSPDVVIFGQAAFGDKVRDGQDDGEAFFEGFVLRTGLTYFPTMYTALTADFEFAGSDNYIDSSDPGRHFGASLRGKTQIVESMPLFFTYEASFTYTSGTDEGEQVEEWAGAVGIEIPFGATTVKSQWTDGFGIGAPRLPLRASAWTEYID